jgi:2-phospho-L-lactate guanylyltransferase
MPTHALIPVKHLYDSKRRLAHLLSAEVRAGLIGRFLDNLLLTLNATPGIDRALVVTCDPAVVHLARRRGADVLLEPAADGLNTAAARGAAHALAGGASAVLLLPADLPFARVEDIEAMLREVPGSRFQVPGGERSSLAPGPWPLAPLLAICPDETEDGTNALLLAPPGDFTFRYGPGSFRAHLAEAERRGRAAHVVPAPGLRFDLDTESDWLVYNGYLVGVGEE